MLLLTVAEDTTGNLKIVWHTADCRTSKTVLTAHNRNGGQKSDNNIFPYKISSVSRIAEVFHSEKVGGQIRKSFQRAVPLSPNVHLDTCVYDVICIFCTVNLAYSLAERV